MRYLITGGAGFIGSHLVPVLVDRGDEVLVLDNFSTGSSENLFPDPLVTVVNGSVLDALLVDELVSSCDIVVHLAAAVGVRLIVEQPLKSFITNIRGTETVLEAVHRYRRKILLASTSEIYGKTSKAAFAEDDDRVLGSISISRWGYATSKAADEVLAFAYHRERNVPTVIVRLFNTVGPRQSAAYGMVLPRLVTQALAGEDLTVHGDGLQSRCFCHVKDVVEALVRLIDEPKAEGTVFNVGSTEEVTILEVAQTIIELTKSRSSISLIPYDQAYESGFEDMRRRVPDISRIKGLVGWEPKYQLVEILSEIIEERSTDGIKSSRK